MEEILPLEVDAACEYDVGYTVKASRPYKLVRDVRGSLKVADLPPALECLETERCANSKIPCLQALRKHPERYVHIGPEDLKKFKDYLKLQQPPPRPEQPEKP